MAAAFHFEIASDASVRAPIRRVARFELESNPGLDVDAELVRHCQQQGPLATQSFALLVARHSERIRRRAARILGSDSDADDIVQDVFVNVHRFLDRYEPNRPFAHWLSVVTLNACRIELRRRAGRARRHDAFQREPAHESNPTPEADPLLRDWFDQHLAELREPTRTCILLRVVEGLSFPEIARRQNASVPAVKMRVARGLRELRDRYLEESHKLDRAA